MEETRLDAFDRVIGAIEGLPDVHKARPSTVTTTLPIIGISQTYVVQTYRNADGGYHVFLQVIDSERGTRIAIPPKVADAIYRQRDALAKVSRRRKARDRWDQMPESKRAATVARLRRKPAAGD